MVFKGVPSRDCQACKSRKAKCDQTQPACRRCTSTGRICPGVPSEFDMRFRDLTRDIKLGTKRKYSRKKRTVSTVPSLVPEEEAPNGVTATEMSKPPTKPNASDTAVSTVGDIYFSPDSYHDYSPISSDSEAAVLGHLDDGADSHDELVISPHAKSLVTKSLRYPIESRAIGAFFKFLYEVNAPLPVIGVGPFMQHLAPLFTKATSSSPLRYATEAVSFAIFARSPDTAHFLDNAASAYLKALRLAQASINDPRLATNNDTLMATMMLSVYECFNPSSTENRTSLYRKHLEGAVSLVHHRGTSKFTDPTSLALFRAIRLQVICNHVHRRKRLGEFDKKFKWNSVPVKDGDPLDILAVLVIDLPQWMEQVDSLERQPAADTALELTSLIYQAWKLDADLQQWYNDLPDDWYPWPSTVAPMLAENSTSEPRAADAYRTIQYAYVLNYYRSMRIYLHEVFLQCLAISTTPGTTANNESESVRFTSFDNQGSVSSAARNSRIIIQRMVDDICASVPYHMNNESFRNEANAGRRIMPPVGGFYLYQALYLASRVEYVPESQKQWVESRLDGLPSLTGPVSKKSPLDIKTKQKMFGVGRNINALAQRVYGD